MSKDHALLLNHVRPLIASRNNAVILSACRLLLHAGIASEYDYHRCAASLTFALRANSGQRATMMAVVSGGDPQAQECLLQLLLYLCVHHPQTVRPYLRRLLVDHVCDTPRVVALKLDCYSHLASAENLPTLIGEFQSCSSSAMRLSSLANPDERSRCAVHGPRERPGHPHCPTI